MQRIIHKVIKLDIPQWLFLRRKLWPGPRKMHLQDMEKLFGKRGFVCFLAWHGDQAVGFAEAMIRPFANGCHDRPVPFLEGLWVESKFRRKNVGRQLVAAVEEWAKKKGFCELGSDAYIAAHVSHQAHRAYGFNETERVVYFRKSLRR
ncbi:MAG: GNAT family N-acetyltransferase [Oligoflexia bacterium]|nr:GNAT family N-acetyltransferase [Oligoflexia bacterium]